MPTFIHWEEEENETNIEESETREVVENSWEGGVP